MSAPKRQNRSYSIEFKKEMVNRVENGESVISLSKENNMHQSVIRQWIKRFGTQEKPLTLLNKEYAELANKYKKENEELKQKIKTQEEFYNKQTTLLISSLTSSLNHT